MKTKSASENILVRTLLAGELVLSEAQTAKCKLAALLMAYIGLHMFGL